MEAGRKQLRDWMRRRQLNGREAAKLLGFHYTLLSNYVTGKRFPGRDNAVAIERETGIPVEAWSPTLEGKTYVPKTRRGRKQRRQRTNAHAA